MTPKRDVRLALAGCGVVGGGLVRLLHDARDEIASRFDVNFSVASVLVRNPTRERHVPVADSLFTNDLDAFLQTDADVVVEAIGGEEPAETIASAALRSGRKFITANKELIAGAGDRLCLLARETGTSLDFGAAVGASAPVISTLRDLLGASPPRSVRGILNGTSNFVITELERGAELDRALAAARERGLAEADCSRDLDGRDAAAKLAISAWIAFGIAPSTLRIRRTSLLPGLPALTRSAIGLGGRLRLVAECVQLDGNRVVAAVEPTVVSAASGFARTLGEENRIEIDQGWSAPLTVSGPGAGAEPTATALLSDLLRTSPPPNARGAQARIFVPATDGREHRWLLLAQHGSGLVQRAVAHGVTIERSWSDTNGVGAVTSRLEWNRVENFAVALRASNESVAIARVELSDAEVRVQ
ncbi:MAG TPA: homoserine dehydrogenase [Gemmatimonadaceae bacterium]|nr:homoserine dehydrogenase [Gemmatimonadaceae bacterium]